MICNVHTCGLTSLGQVGSIVQYQHIINTFISKHTVKNEVPGPISSVKVGHQCTCKLLYVYMKIYLQNFIVIEFVIRV